MSIFFSFLGFFSMRTFFLQSGMEKVLQHSELGFFLAVAGFPPPLFSFMLWRTNLRSPPFPPPFREGSSVGTVSLLSEIALFSYESGSSCLAHVGTLPLFSKRPPKNGWFFDGLHRLINFFPAWSALFVYVFFPSSFPRTKSEKSCGSSPLPPPPSYLFCHY